LGRFYLVQRKKLSGGGPLGKELTETQSRRPL
jgi:hypothetical protein